MTHWFNRLRQFVSPTSPATVLVILFFAVFNLVRGDLDHARTIEPGGPIHYPTLLDYFLRSVLAGTCAVEFGILALAIGSTPLRARSALTALTAGTLWFATWANSSSHFPSNDIELWRILVFERYTTAAVIVLGAALPFQLTRCLFAYVAVPKSLGFVMRDEKQPFRDCAINLASLVILTLVRLLVGWISIHGVESVFSFLKANLSAFILSTMFLVPTVYVVFIRPGGWRGLSVWAAIVLVFTLIFTALVITYVEFGNSMVSAGNSRGRGVPEAAGKIMGTPLGCAIGLAVTFAAVRLRGAAHCWLPLELTVSASSPRAWFDAIASVREE